MTLEEYVRDVLRANLFDGDDGGVTTYRIATLLDDASESLAELFRSDGYRVVKLVGDNSSPHIPEAFMVAEELA